MLGSEDPYGQDAQINTVIWVPARQDFYWAGVRDYLHFQPDLIRMAAKVVRRVLDTAGGPYNALHYRSTDWCARLPPEFREQRPQGYGHTETDFARVDAGRNSTRACSSRRKP